MRAQAERERQIIREAIKRDPRIYYLLRGLCDQGAGPPAAPTPTRKRAAKRSHAGKVRS